MPDIAFDRYYRYDELTQILQSYADEHADLIDLEAIGQSHEGRDIWMLTVTDKSTGAAADKPAFWCDGNIHASEVSASTTVLKIIDLLVTERPDVLKTRAFYLVPRLNPDGAEWALADKPKIIRSSTRPYPYDEDDIEGLERMDVDGDGRMLNMRLPDPNGAWVKAEEEPRLLRRREPDDTQGPFYRIVPEGLFTNFDGLTMRPRKGKEGLDMNRNFPAGWRPENEQYGAGPYPTSEPEIRAAVQAITSHSNICGAITYHTYSGVILRVPGSHPDDELPPEDLWAMKAMGSKGTEMTGYPCISVWHEFKYHPKEHISGVFDEWVYNHQGVYAWTVEIWAPQRQAGITDYKYIDWFRDHPFEDDLKMLAWSDEKLDGKGYVDWYSFDHPQLGPVEIGGWDAMYAFRNPPPQYLEEEITPLARWAIWMASATPRLVERSFEILEEGDFARIRWAVQNEGWLPTAVTKHAEAKKLVRGVIGEISDGTSFEPGSDAPIWLVAGRLREVQGQLSGWSQSPKSTFGYSFDATSDVAVFEWVVRRGKTYQLTARHDRAGRIARSVDV